MKYVTKLLAWIGMSPPQKAAKPSAEPVAPQIPTGAPTAPTSL